VSKLFKPLAELVISNGLQTGPFGSQLKAEEYTERGVPVVMPKDIYAGKIIDGSIARTSQEKAATLKKYLLQKGDVLFPRRGDLGQIGLATEENTGWICGTGCLRARLKPEILDKYIYQYVQMPQVKRWLERNALGQTMLNLNTEIISELPIYIPSKREQEDITQILDVWDSAIEKTERLIAAKQKQFDWLMRTLIIDQCSLNNTDSSLVKLGDIEGPHVVIEKGKPLKKSEVSEGIIPVIAGGRSSPYSHNQSTHESPCITVSASGAYAGYVWFHQKPIWASDCNVIYSKNGKTEYLYYTLKAQQKKIFSLQKGGGQPHVYANDLKSLHIYLPSIEEQNRIVNILSAAQKEIALLEKLADKYRTQKRGLMQKLLTGEWRINAAKEVAWV
jgi:type I restriction enzyme S subunit